jgi:hypothetical protein
MFNVLKFFSFGETWSMGGECYSDQVSKRKRWYQLSQKVRFSSHGELKLKSWVRETSKREVSLEMLTDCFLIK